MILNPISTCFSYLNPVSAYFKVSVWREELPTYVKGAVKWYLVLRREDRVVQSYNFDSLDLNRTFMEEVVNKNYDEKCFWAMKIKLVPVLNDRFKELLNDNWC